MWHANSAWHFGASHRDKATHQSKPIGEENFWRMCTRCFGCKCRRVWPVFGRHGPTLPPTASAPLFSWHETDDHTQIQIHVGTGKGIWQVESDQYGEPHTSECPIYNRPYGAGTPMEGFFTCLGWCLCKCWLGSKWCHDKSPADLQFQQRVSPWVPSSLGALADVSRRQKSKAAQRSKCERSEGTKKNAAGRSSILSSSCMAQAKSSNRCLVGLESFCFLLLLISCVIDEVGCGLWYVLVVQERRRMTKEDVRQRRVNIQEKHAATKQERAVALLKRLLLQWQKFLLKRSTKSQWETCEEFSMHLRGFRKAIHVIIRIHQLGSRGILESKPPHSLQRIRPISWMLCAKFCSLWGPPVQLPVNLASGTMLSGTGDLVDEKSPAFPMQ